MYEVYKNTPSGLFVFENKDAMDDIDITYAPRRKNTLISYRYFARK
jgi:hypothetical protein